MLLRTLIIALVFYVANLVSLWLWPAYTDVWAQFAYTTAGINAISWTVWATAAEWGRFVLLAGLSIGAALLTGKRAAPRLTPHEKKVRETLEIVVDMKYPGRLQMLTKCYKDLPDQLTTDEVLDLVGRLSDEAVKAASHASTFSSIVPITMGGGTPSDQDSHERTEAIKLLAPKLPLEAPSAPLLIGLSDKAKIEIMDCIKPTKGRHP